MSAPAQSNAHTVVPFTIGNFLARTPRTTVENGHASSALIRTQDLNG